MHIKQVIIAIRQKGLEEACKRLLKTEIKCKTKLKEATMNVEFTPEGQDMTRQQQAEKAAAETYETAQEATTSVGEQVFQLYSNLIIEKAGKPWTKIMTEQIDATTQTYREQSMLMNSAVMDLLQGVCEIPSTKNFLY